MGKKEQQQESEHPNLCLALISAVQIEHCITVPACLLFVLRCALRVIISSLYDVALALTRRLYSEKGVV